MANKVASLQAHYSNAAAAAAAAAVAMEEKPHSASTTSLPSITMLQLRAHCTREDLWIAINGNVYDVSPWLSAHPGGEKLLLSVGGKEVTDTFLAFHPPRAALLLPRFLVATLQDYKVPPLSMDYRQTLSQLRKEGHFHREFSPYFRLAVILSAMFCLCIALVIFCRSFLAHMCSAVLLGCVWSQTSFVMHDYAHSAFLRNPNLNLCVQTVIANCITGLSPSWWKKSHNAHHVCTNNLSRDPDLQFIPFFAVSSSFFSSLYSYYHERQMNFTGLAKRLVSYQHWTFYPVMLIARINLFLQAFVFFTSEERMQNRAVEVGGIVCFWTWFLALLACLPDGKERVAYLLVSSAATAVQHLQFCLNHFSCEVMEDDKPASNSEGDTGDGDGEEQGTSFLMSQVKGTMNIDCPAWMDWFHGGLQFQLEHHLFPRMPRHNLRRVSGKVKALCERHGLPYESVGFWQANCMLFRTLRTAAMQARQL